MIKFMLIALMACSGGQEEAAPVAPVAETPATELSITVEAPADAAATPAADAETVDAATTTTESTDTTSAK